MFRISSTLHRRRGFTLVETIVCLAIIGVLGVALTRLMLAQSRLFAMQRARRDARAVARASMNLVLSELRMVHDGADAPGGVLLASPESLQVRVPYAMGVVCGNNGAAATIASMLPLDSAVIASAKYAGYAWRNHVTKTYTYIPAVDTVLNAPQLSSMPTTCTTIAKISSDTINGRVWMPLDVRPIAIAAGLQPGAPVFFYQEVLYWFGPSATYTGKFALWRKVQARGADELSAPFDTTARFKFFLRGADTSMVAAPVVLDSLVGVSFVLNGASAAPVPGRPAEISKMETAVLFRNHPGF